MAAVGQEKKAEATRQRSRRHCELYCLSAFAVLLGIWIGSVMCMVADVRSDAAVMGYGDVFIIYFLL